MLLITHLASKMQKFYIDTGKLPESIYVGTIAYRTICCEIKDELNSSVKITIQGLKINAIPILEHPILPPNEILFKGEIPYACRF